MVDVADLGFILLITLLVTWSAIWKGIGLWKSARHNQVRWFLAIFIFNTAGILPIMYLTWFQKGQNGGKKGS